MKKIYLNQVFTFFIITLYITGCGVDYSDKNEGLPILSTTNVINITSETATSGGNITSNGGFVITARGICWSSNRNPSIIDNMTVNGSGMGVFTSNITGIEPNNIYFVRAYATNEIETVYGNEISFSTYGLPIGVTTKEITDLTDTSAFSGGNISENGGYTIISRGVCWSTNLNPEVSNNKTSDGSGIGNFISKIENLSSWKTYYLRAYATNEIGTTYGNEIFFSTVGTTVTDYNGNIYPVVKIGKQIWMAENLKTTSYNDGTPIDESHYWNSYGKLYNWHTIETDLLCPDGWRIPNDDDFNDLKAYISNEGFQVGTALKAKSGWGHNGWNDRHTIYMNGTDNYGFTALPAGLNYEGVKVAMGFETYFWTTSDSGGSDEIWTWCLDESANFYHYPYNKSSGCSVRCIKDK